MDISIKKSIRITAQKKMKQNRRNKYMYVLLFPAIISVVIFGYLPLMGTIIAFKDYDVLVGFQKSPWVGFAHFRSIFEMPSFLSAIKNTVVYSFVCLFGAFPFPIILAIMVNEVKNIRFKKFSQSILYLPHFLSWISVIGFIYSIFSLNGSFNSLMKFIFGNSYEASNILFDSKNFLALLFASRIWKEVGWSAVIYFAAIAGIDPTLYEAAGIDGANRYRRIWHITLPGLKTTAILILIMNMGSLVKSNFEQVYGLQNAYIQQETDVIDTLAYRRGIQGGEYSISTALGLAQGIASVLLVMTANKLSKKVTQTSIW